jgi:glycogen debranching enzyme
LFKWELAVARTDVNLFWLRPGEHSAHRGHSILITDEEGRVRSGMQGFFLRRTRFLSRLLMKVNDEEPHYVSANPVEPHFLISYHLAPSPAGAAAGPPEDKEKSGGEMAQKAIEIQVNRFVGGGLHLDIHVTNHGLAEATVPLSWELAADYADQEEAESGQRQQKAPVELNWTKHRHGGELAFHYRHPELSHATILRFAGPTDFVEGMGSISCSLHLAPQQTRTLSLDVAPVFKGERIDPFYGLDGAIKHGCPADQVREEWNAGCVRLRTTNPLVQTAWERAAADLGSLHLLEGEGPERFTPAAGIPKYTGLFGRDTLITAWQSALLNPATLRGTLRLIAKWNAEEYDDRYDAQPGKVLHQHQLSPLALLGKNAFLHYYGDYSAAGLFLFGLANDLAHSGDKEFFLSMRDKALATLEWMDRDGDSDHDGFYEYQTRAGKLGTKNQGWKDSEQAILYPDGRVVADPIAVCEVQGLYYAAKQAMGLAFAAVGEHARATDLLAQADALKRRFNDRFWLEEEQFIALALDPDKRPVKSVASNPGGCLAYGIVDADKAQAVADRLMAPDMFSGWGIRTLSSEHPAFNPLAYHLGTVWPFENATTAYGLKRYGFDPMLHRVAKGLFDASELFHLDRLPEVFGGHQRDHRHAHPGIYPGACAPQAWSASAVIMLVQAMLGLTPLAPLNTLILDPDLPDWLPEVTLEGVQVGAARVDLHFWRDDSGFTNHKVTQASGALRVHRPKHPSGSGPEDLFAAAVREVIG